MKRRNFAGLIGLACLPSVAKGEKRKCKRITIDKYDDGTFDVVCGNIEEFNHGGGIITTNIGELQPDSLTICLYMINGFTGSPNPYRTKVSIHKDDSYADMCQKIQLFGYCASKTAKRLIGENEWSANYPDPCTYKEAEEQFVFQQHFMKAHKKINQT